MESLRRNEAFWRLFTGRLVTNAGDSLYFIAAMWLVFDLTGSTLYTGFAGFLVRFPRALQFLVGPLVDRWRLRRLLVGTQLVQGCCVLVVPLAAAAGHLSVWLVLVVLPLLSALNQFVYPAQNAALPRIVAEDDLVRANSLFASAYKAADAVFNAASGLLIAAVGAVWLFVVDAITFAVAGALFLGLRVPAADADEPPHDREPADGPSYLDSLRTGIAYLRGSAVLSVVVGVMVANLAFGATFAVLPAFADSIGGPATYGALMAAYAGGLLAGTVGSNVVETRPYGRLCVVAFVWAGLALAGAVVVPGWLATVGLFFVAFVPIGAFSVLFWTLIQSVVDDGLLGRVTSIVSSLAALMLPAGSLLGGAVAGRFGVESVLLSLAVALVALAVWFLASPGLRTLPSVTEADGPALGLPSLR